ncbi:RNA polymerase sigma factor [Nakamurella lactea]|uniref:RNA polymerase sigma factor n=1 Tax=Nakamurella lactea TaxID=459515 RepID=UPI001B7FC606|nr:SigE family RNA polymerase sigma factor [Nakamurella lactea]
MERLNEVEQLEAAVAPTSTDRMRPDRTGTGQRPGIAGPAGVASPIDQLYRTYWDSLVRLAWLMTGDQSTAEEVVADALVALHRRWDGLGTVANLPAYLRRSVINGCRSHGRRRVLERAHLANEANVVARIGDAPSAEAQVLERFGRADVLSALAQLPRRQREVLVLRYYLDLSEGQIAETLDVSPGSVKSHAHRGLAALRDRMADHNPLEDR